MLQVWWLHRPPEPSGQRALRSARQGAGLSLVTCPVACKALPKSAASTPPVLHHVCSTSARSLYTAVSPSKRSDPRQQTHVTRVEPLRYAVHAADSENTKRKHDSQTAWKRNAGSTVSQLFDIRMPWKRYERSRLKTRVDCKMPRKRYARDVISKRSDP